MSITADQLVKAYVASTGATTIPLAEVCRLAMELRKRRLDALLFGKPVEEVRE